jgi:hypothetical protein
MEQDRRKFFFAELTDSVYRSLSGWFWLTNGKDQIRHQHLLAWGICQI